ncbi:DegT/DnrJ/EryC1/StrS family aminotransferase [Haloplanus aerogenes]|uniref:DegT/DnrJ/EryC1/StrS family aminotransferase n=1 Tax=Haloplanus aerogenes TaxID=660522 RepID=A0A3M0DFW5_9EURY|nr:DegT/DnrJ/EryC1/StrS family aminotransferase [Haloplanus aerogenes]AZH26322.1 DegT/DnrJ/EryC1/StrS family aminotransferase [Haloplanus aerogenes]RMB18219.1 dTDP-4-amino-4,6-dideoxygalactose transaminase [Haloplanus aerogenes]
MEQLARDGGDAVRPDGIALSKPVVGDEEIDRVGDVLRSGWVTTGDETEAFEAAIADRLGTDHAIGTTNCSSALEITYRALELDGDVLTTPMTFATTVSGLVRAGANPILCDVRADTFTLDIESVKEAITPQTTAIVPVHFAGQGVEMDAILDLAADHDLTVVEDAAHGLGASYEGTPLGTLGDVGCFSFHATKSITTGEGGMLVTADEAVAELTRRLRLAGVDKDATARSDGEAPNWAYDVTAVAGKCNMNDVRAAIGIEQLSKLDDFVAARCTVAAALDDGLTDVPGVTPLTVRDPSEHARHLYPVLLDEETLGVDRRTFETALNAEGIATGVYYIPIHHHSAFDDIDRMDLSTTEDVASRTLCLPIHPGMDKRDAADVIRAVEKVVDLL